MVGCCGLNRSASALLVIRWSAIYDSSAWRLRAAAAAELAGNKAACCRLEMTAPCRDRATAAAVAKSPAAVCCAVEAADAKDEEDEEEDETDEMVDMLGSRCWCDTVVDCGEPLAMDCETAAWSMLGS